MKISVVIPTHNSAQTIRDTIDTLISQTHEDFEALIVDYKSTDSTIAILQEYQKTDSRIHVLTASKQGIYPAINDGIKSSSGEIITVLNSDDFYDENSVLENILISFRKDNADACYGDLLIVNRFHPEKIIRYWKSGNFNYNLIFSGWSPPHPTLFIKKDIYFKPNESRLPS